MAYDPNSALDKRLFALGNIAHIGSTLEHLTLELVAGFVSSNRRAAFIALSGTNWVRLLQMLDRYIDATPLDDGLKTELRGWKTRADKIRGRRNRIIHDVTLVDDLYTPNEMGRITPSGEAAFSQEEPDLDVLWQDILQVVLDLSPITKRLKDSPDWYGISGAVLRGSGSIVNGPR